MSKNTGLICTSLIFPWEDNKNFYELAVYSTKHKMLKAIEEFDRVLEDCQACVISFKKPVKNCLGRIFFFKRSFDDTGIIAHESVHAGIQYCRAVKKLKNFDKIANEEALAYTIQNLYNLLVEIAIELQERS